MKKLGKLSLLASFALMPALGVLSGCGKFFPPLDQCTDCTTSVSYMYIANQSTSAPAIASAVLTKTTTPASGTSAATSTLSVSGANYALSYLPTALAITPANTFLYVGETDLQSGAIYVYAINTDRSLTLQSAVQPIATVTYPVAMQVDPNGNNLVVLNYSTGTTQAVISSYKIDTSTGALTFTGSYTIPHAGASQQMAISPTAQTTGIQNVIVTLGTGGIEAFTLNSSTGALTDQGNLAPLSATNGSQDLGVAIDPTNTYVFATETISNALREFTFTTGGGLTAVSGTPPSTGIFPTAVLVDAAGKYVYVTNKTAATVSGFTLDSGALTALTSTFATGVGPVGLAEDSTNSYIGVVNIGGSPDLSMFSFDTTTDGNLDAALSVSTSSTKPAQAALIVAVHAD